MRWFRLFILLVFGLLALSIACSITVPPSETSEPEEGTVEPGVDQATTAAQPAIATEEQVATAVAATLTAIALEEQAATAIAVETTAIQQTATATPTLSPPTTTPTVVPISTPCHSDPTVYDDFDCPEFERGFDTRRWMYFGSNLAETIVEQNNGFLTLSRQSPSSGQLTHSPLKINEIGFVEAKLKLDKNIEASIGSVGIGVRFGSWWLTCDVSGRPGSDEGWTICHTADGFGANTGLDPYNSWHTVRFEINPETAAISFFVDGTQIGSEYISPNPEEFKQADFTLNLQVWSEDGGLTTGYADDVRIGQFGQ